MAGLSHYVVFTLDERCYALSLGAVDRVVQAVEVTPLPWAPEAVLGVINVQGRIIPVFSVRRRLGLPQHDIDPGDQFIIGQAARHAVVLVVDAVVGVGEYAGREPRLAEGGIPGTTFLPAAGGGDDGLLLILDLDRFLLGDGDWTFAAALEAGVEAAA